MHLLSNETAALKAEIRKSASSNLAQQVSQERVLPNGNEVPLSPDIVVLEHDEVSPQSDPQSTGEDESALSDSNTIDDNVPEYNNSHSLNYSHPTTQLTQLTPSQNSSQQ